MGLLFPRTIVWGRQPQRTAYLAQHGEPTISLRMEFAGGDVVAYSADKGPHPGMAAAYHSCTTLDHECTTTAAAPPDAYHCRTVDVGRIAQEAGVARLIVLHLGDTAFVPVEQVRTEIAAHYRDDLVIARRTPEPSPFSPPGEVGREGRADYPCGRCAGA
jgi:ribonuclease BN (tRNA processing enzyme)